MSLNNYTNERVIIVWFNSMDGRIILVCVMYARHQLVNKGPLVSSQIRKFITQQMEDVCYNNITIIAVKIPPKGVMILVLQKTAHTPLQRGTSQPELSAFWELWCTQLSYGLPATISLLWEQLSPWLRLKFCQRIYQSFSGPTLKKILNCLEEIPEKDWMRLLWSYTLFFDKFLQRTHLLVCFLILHDCACKSNNMVNETSGEAIQTVSSLDTKENRKEWERLFSHHYIQPVLSTLDQSLTKAIDRVAKDKKQG